MPDDGSTPWGLWCPDCLTPVGDQDRCPQCDLPQAGPEPARLRVVRARLHELGEQQAALASESAALAVERDDLLALLRTPPPPVGAVSAPAEREPTLDLADWRPERVRDALLWLGSTLLALSAITFVIVAWTRLDPAGRAGLLLGTTVVAGAAAVGLRRRLPATAEALAGLALVLALVDWFALRRSGAGSGVSVAAWWASGTALVACIGLAGALALGLRSARLGTAILALTSGAFVVAATCATAWTAAVGLALVATAAVIAAAFVPRRFGWRDASVLLVVGSSLFELVAFGFAMAAVDGIGDSAGFGPALAVLALGSAPAVAVAFSGDRRGKPKVDGLVGLATAAVIGAPVTLLMRDVDPSALAVVAAWIGVVALLIARAASRTLRVGVAGAGTGALTVGIASALPSIGLAIIGPLAWLEEPWSGSLANAARSQFGPSDPVVLQAGWAAAGVMLALFVGAAVAGARSRGFPPFISTARVALVAAIALPAAVAVALPASGASIAIVLVVEASLAVGLAGLAAGQESPRLVSLLLAASSLLLLPAVGWAAVDRTATLVLLASVIAAAAFAGLRARLAVTRVALITVGSVAALAEAGALVAAWHDGDAGPVGFVVATTGGALLALGTLARRSAPEGPALEAVGVIGLVLGTAISAVSAPWLAGTLTVATPAYSAATLGRIRTRGYATMTVATALGAVWAWLAVTDVSLLEAYTLPAAAVLLAVGSIRRHSNPAVGSWSAYGPGLVLLLGPSLLLALDPGQAVRSLAVIVAALVCVLVGARLRLQAPLALGALALLTLAVNDLGPVAAQLPRWVLLAAAGLLLLWLGASAERRLEQVRQWRNAVDQLA